MTTTTDDDLHLNRARRYAEAIATAAAAEARIEALTETIAEHEAARTSAESAVSAFDWSPHLGKVFHSGTDIPDDVEAIMDLTDGAVWIRVVGQEPNTWRDAMTASSRVYNIETWPMDPGGPFVAIRDDWKIRKMHDVADQHDENMKEILAYVRREVGWGNGPVLEQPLDAVIRMKKHVTEETQNVYSRLVEAGARHQADIDRIRLLEMRCDALVSQMEAAGLEPQGYDPR